jgi:hypothetical protein
VPDVGSQEIREHDDRQFREFAAGQRHWKIARHETGSAAGETASRMFTYHGGARALLWVERYDDRRLSWEAGINLQFSAGPELTHSDRRFTSVREWAVLYETILEAPLVMAKASSGEAVLRASRVIDRNGGWWLMCNIFDLPYTTVAGWEFLRSQLIKRVAPHLTGSKV